MSAKRTMVQQEVSRRVIVFMAELASLSMRTGQSVAEYHAMLDAMVSQLQEEVAIIKDAG